MSATTSKNIIYVYNDIKKEFSNMSKTFNIVIHDSEQGGYYAECPMLKGCYSQGDTIEELKNNMSEAIELYLEDTPYAFDSTENNIILEVSNA